MPCTFINCLSGQWGGVQYKWYQGSKSCLVYFAGVVCKMYCPALVNSGRVGPGTLVLISRIIVHETKAAALVTKSYSNQDKESVSLLLAVGQISCNIQSLSSSRSLVVGMLVGLLVFWNTLWKSYLNYNARKQKHFDWKLFPHTVVSKKERKITINFLFTQNHFTRKKKIHKTFF